MRLEQEIAYVLPWTFGPRPRPKELNRITFRLAPAPIYLQRLIQTPAQISPPFVIKYGATLLSVCSPLCVPYCVVPTLFPNIDSDSTNTVNICRPSHPVVPKDAQLEKDTDPPSGVSVCFFREAFKHALQLCGQV